MHSQVSDGSMSPKELVIYAKQKGVKIMSLTDHESVDGIEEAIETAKDEGIICIPGIETSVEFDTEMHILAYFSDENYKNIKSLADKLRLGRQDRNIKVVEKLCSLGMPITIEEVSKIAWNGIASRPHIAKIMLEKGYVKSIKEAFDRFLYNGGPAYSKRQDISPGDYIKEVIKNGGVPVLAHPILIGYGWNQLDKLIGNLTEQGLKGMEVYYSENTGDDTGKLLRIALKYNLLATGGSDYHGSFKPWLEPGVGRGKLVVPNECAVKLMNMLYK